MMWIELDLDGDNAWPDLNDPKMTIHHLADGGPPIKIAGLDGGMKSGDPSVAIRIDIGEREMVVAETSLALFLAAADALRARFGDPKNGWKQ